MHPSRSQCRHPPGEGRSPRWSAWVTAAVRSETPSLSKTCSRCDFTVASPMNSSRATSGFDIPRETSASTSSSRGVSWSPPRTWRISLAASGGASTVSPRAAALTAASSWSRGVSLSR